MAFDPIKALVAYSDTECAVQFWEKDTPAVSCPSLEAAARYARDNGAGWKDVEITVHLPQEDIVYATGKARSLIEALRLRAG